MNYYAIGGGRYIIAHHGVQGMKWGIRRYQPYGQGGYNRKGGATGKEIGKAKPTTSEKYSRNVIEKDFLKDNNLLSGSSYSGTKREKEAADLGLEAMRRAGVGDTWSLENMKESERESFREWFMIEDQTIGYGLVADQVNQGKSKEQIKEIINYAKKADYSHAYDPGYFELIEYHDPGDKYLNACLEVKSKNDEARALRKELKHHMRFAERIGGDMYSNNDFRYYKGGDYLAHYGKKGMKWHKHLKATTDWWKYDVTGSGYKQDAERASAKSDAAFKLSQKRFTDYQKSGRKADIDSAAKYAHRSLNYGKQADYNKDQYKKKRDVKSRLKNAISTKTRNTKLFIDSRITGSTARKVAAREDRKYREDVRESNTQTGYAARGSKYYNKNDRPDFVKRDIATARNHAAYYNKEAVGHLNKRNKAQSEYEKSLRGKAEKRINKLFKKHKKRR